MKIVDLNILLYLTNRNAPQHAAIKRWWEKAVDGDESLGLPWVVLLGYLRVATHQQIFPNPLTPQEAIERLDTWLSLAITSVVEEKPDHWFILRSLLQESGTAANLTTDAHLAALAIGHGAVLVSCDHDFARFASLRWQNPIKNKSDRQ